MIKEHTKSQSSFKGSQSNIKNVQSSHLLQESDIKSFFDIYKNNITHFFERIDNYESFFTTQQIESIDYEKFEEHVFFDSAVEKVNYAFDQIVNFFPYDQTKFNYDQYIKKLDGFSRYVLNHKVNKNLGYLDSGDINSGVVIKDKKGNLFDDYNKSDVFNNFSLTGDFKINFWIRPKKNNAEQRECIFKKLYNDNSSAYGLIIYLDNFESVDIDENLKIDFCNINFALMTEYNFFKSSYKIQCGEFVNINYSINREINNDIIARRFYLYVNGKLINKNSNDYEETGSHINKITLSESSLIDNYNSQDVYLCNSDIQNISLDFGTAGLEIPDISKYNGLIDEFRFYAGNNITNEDLQHEIKNNVFSSKNIVLNLRFNEPSGSYVNSDVILDYSGNKLHGLIMDFDNANNATGIVSYNNYTRIENDPLVKTPVLYENILDNPILFSSKSHEKRQEMLEEAKIYDLENPNSFWKLFPKNMFIEGSDFDNVDQVYQGEKDKNLNKFLGIEKNISHELIKLISIWARFFDQLKIYIDAFSEMLNISYDTIDEQKKVDGVILPIALKKMGFNIKEIFNIPTKEKLDKKNLTREEIISEYSIRQIQNILWKRLMINSRDILTSKGTHRSIKSVFNIFGLEADRFVTIKEITGQNKLNIENNFLIKNKNIKVIDFNRHNEKYVENVEFSTLGNVPEPLNKIFFKTKRMGQEELDISRDFCFESYICFKSNDLELYKNNQSIFRIDKLSGLLATQPHRPFLNVVFSRKNNFVRSGEVKIYLNLKDNNDFILTHVFDNIEILNGEIYHIVFQKKYLIDKDVFEYSIEIKNTASNTFTGKNFKKIFKLNSLDGNLAAADKFIHFSLGNYRYSDIFINNIFTQMSYETEFEGSLLNVRAYKNKLTSKNISLKSKDILKIGQSSYEESPIEDLLIDNNFSFYIEIDQGDQTEYQFKNIIDKDNEEDFPSRLHVPDKIRNSTNYFPIRFEKILLLSQNSEIDKPSGYNKVHINNHEDENKKFEYQNYTSSNITQVRPDYLYHDDLRCYVDFSCVNFLNQEISKIIDVNEYFSNVLGNSSSRYEESYISLEKTREIFFKRLKSEVNYTALYQTYKYFDNILEDLLNSCIPSKVNYLGFNFVYESHSLERNKYVYKNSDSRLPILNSETNRVHDYHDLSRQGNREKYYRKDIILHDTYTHSIEKTSIADIT